MQEKKVVIYIPSMRDGVRIYTMTSLIASFIEALKAGWAVLIEPCPPGMTPIEAARNWAVDHFLATDASHMFFVDDDIGWEAHAFMRVLESPYPIAGGVYPHRTDRLSFPVQWNEPLEILDIDKEYGFAKVLGLPAGFLCIQRKVLEDLARTHDLDRWYHERASARGKVWEIFDHQNINHTKQSEDFIFCRKAAELGHGTYLCPDITFMHIGSKGFVGNMAAFWSDRKEGGVLMPALRGADGQVQHFHRSIPGWFEADGEMVYRAAVKTAPTPAYFVEVGAWKGRSTAFMATLLANAPEKTIAFDVVDHFKGSDEPGHQADPDVKAGVLRQVFDRYTGPVKEFITSVLEMPSLEAATRYKDGSLDFIFLDAGHDEKSVGADIKAWRPKLKEHGIIAGDDYNWPSVARAVNRFFPDVVQLGRCWIVIPPGQRGKDLVAALAPEGLTMKLEAEKPKRKVKATKRGK